MNDFLRVNFKPRIKHVKSQQYYSLVQYLRVQFGRGGREQLERVLLLEAGGDGLRVVHAAAEDGGEARAIGHGRALPQAGGQRQRGAGLRDHSLREKDV